MTFTLPNLPYAHDALAPHMSKETLEYHHDKHHQAYVTNGNNAIKGTEFEGKSLEEIVKGSFGKNPAVFNNAGQHYNHLHFWNWMKPNGGGTKLPGRLEKKITEDLGGLEKFKTDFAAAGVGQFGSGWAWLSVKNGKLEISKTANGENPLVHGALPILGVDVWEHSYYIDYRNRRPDYLKAVRRSSGELGVCRPVVLQGLISAERFALISGAAASRCRPFVWATGSTAPTSPAPAQRLRRHPCNSNIAVRGKVPRAVADERPNHPRALKPEPQPGTSSAVPSNPNSRGGRRASPIAQGRDRMEHLFVGIDVSKDRLDVHVRPGGETFAVSRDGEGLERLVERFAGALADAGCRGSNRRLRDDRGGGNRRRGTPAGSCEPGPDPSLRAGCRQARQDRSDRCRRNRTLRRSGASGLAGPSRRGIASACRTGRPAPADHRDDGCRTAAREACHQRSRCAKAWSAILLCSRKN